MENDWRLTKQEKYLKGVTLIHRRYRLYPKNPDWTHDHCSFCWATFSLLESNDSLKQGFATTDDYDWVCEGCFEDFKDMFKWEVIEKFIPE